MLELGRCWAAVVDADSALAGIRLFQNRPISGCYGNVDVVIGTTDAVLVSSHNDGRRQTHYSSDKRFHIFNC